jgi:hypothetical protein
VPQGIKPQTFGDQRPLTVANCTICGEPGGLFRLRHVACSEARESEQQTFNINDTTVVVDVMPSVFAGFSEKMGRPYELESQRIEEVVNQVRQLKRESRFEEAVAILISQMDLWEKDSAAGLGGVAPWYYEQAAICYRKLQRFDDEIAVLERFAAQEHAPGLSPPELLRRLEKAKWYALKRAGIKAPKPRSAFDEEDTKRNGAPQKDLPRELPFKSAPGQKPLHDFIALDVETANADSASICSIGLVHFREGEVFKSLTILVDPEDQFDPINMSIHGITPEMVIGKPTMAKVFPVVAPYLSDVVIVHHKECKRDRHVDLPGAAALALCNGLHVGVWVARKLIEPTAPAGDRCDKHRPSFGTDRTRVFGRGGATHQNLTTTR